MTTHYISTLIISVIFLLKFNCDDAVVAFTVGRFAPARMATPSHRSSQHYRTDRRQHLFPFQMKASDHHDYFLEANSNPTINEACTFTEEQIHLLIARRLDCKKRRNFADADRILEALNKNGIYIQDKARKYRVDGENHFGRRKHYVRRGGNKNNQDLAVVQELVEERARCKRQRDYFRSDDLTDLLKEKYGVKVDDKRREWSFVEKPTANDEPKNNVAASDYVPTPLAPKDHPTHTMEDADKDIIRERLAERAMARKSKDYKTADRILDELTNEYSIVVDDRTKEWKVVMASEDSYFDSEDDPFAKEAKLSQRSAFVQTRRKNPSNPFSNINNRWGDEDEDDGGWWDRDRDDGDGNDGDWGN